MTDDFGRPVKRGEIERCRCEACASQKIDEQVRPWLVVIALMVAALAVAYCLA